MDKAAKDPHAASAADKHAAPAGGAAHAADGKDGQEKAGKGQALLQRMQQMRTNTALVLRGVRALLTLPQNRAWSRSLVSLFTLNLLIFILWRSSALLGGQGAIKAASDPVQPQWLAVHAPWRADDAAHADGDSHQEGSVKTVRCRRWGPFNAIDLRRVDQLLADWGGERKLITETEPIAYQVYWPTSAKDTAGFMKELRIKGFADAIVSSNEDVTRGQVVYGTYRTRGQAKAKIEYLEGKGFPGATIFTRMGPSKTVYELRGTEEQIEELVEIRTKFDFGTLTACTAGAGKPDAH